MRVLFPVFVSALWDIKGKCLNVACFMNYWWASTTENEKSYVGIRGR